VLLSPTSPSHTQTHKTHRQTMLAASGSSPRTSHQHAVGGAAAAEDPLNASSDFDAVAYINQYFPSERSLEKLDDFTARISEEITGLDIDISAAVQAQSEAGLQAVKDVSEAQAAITELFLKIRDIKDKAQQSEVSMSRN
jgi:hypothetical protein